MVDLYLVACQFTALLFCKWYNFCRMGRIDIFVNTIRTFRIVRISKNWGIQDCQEYQDCHDCQDCPQLIPRPKLTVIAARWRRYRQTKQQQPSFSVCSLNLSPLMILIGQLILSWLKQCAYNSAFNRASQSVVFNRGQKMALRPVYVAIY